MNFHMASGARITPERALPADAAIMTDRYLDAVTYVFVAGAVDTDLGVPPESPYLHDTTNRPSFYWAGRLFTGTGQ